jgi:hypothetical protein
MFGIYESAKLKKRKSSCRIIVELIFTLKSKEKAEIV